MAEKTPQTLENHGKLVTGFHIVTTVFLLYFTIWSVIQLLRQPGWDSFAFVTAAVTLNLLGWYVRAFATQNQDRIIRLEERLRMKELLPGELQGRVDDFTTAQLIALRFASDEELPELARRVLEEGITDRKAIKQMVRSWRPDYQRI